jgi:nitrate reductase gamma subunit
MNGFSFFAAGIMIYIAVIVFLIGMAYRIFLWVKAPRSQVRLGLFPRPKNKTARFFKILKDSFIFSHSAEVDPWMWVFSIVFHFSLAAVLVAHFRMIREFTPLANLIGKEGMEKLGAIAGGTLGVILLIVILFYLLRRFLSPYKELSVFEDYFVIFLLIVIILLGDHLRFFAGFSVEDYRLYMQSILVFRPAFPDAIASSGARWVLTMHVFFVNLFVIYFPFSKLTHAIGTFAVNTVRSDV